MKIFNALQTQFTNLDAAIRRYVNQKLGSQSASYTSSNIFGMILNVVKSLWQNGLLYLEDAVQEQNVKTATRTQSIFSLARLSGYNPFYGYAAQGVLNAQLLPNNESNSSRCVIPNHIRVRHIETGKVYLVDLPYDYLSVSFDSRFETLQLPIIQGTFQNAQWVARGKPLETFSVKTSSFYDINYITVTVNGKQWDKYESLYDMNSNSEGFMVQQGFDGEFQIVFGNNTHGKIPKNGDTVICQYLTHRGEYGNIGISSGDKFVFYDSIKDGEGNNIDGNELFVLNKVGVISGGINAESVEQVRKMIGYNSRSCVLANADNYKLFLERFSFTGSNYVWTEPGSMNLNICVLANTAQNIKDPIKYFNLNPGDFLLSDEQKEIIIKTIENSKQSFAGTQINFVDPIIRKFALLVYIKKKPEFENEVLIADIKKCIGEYFCNISEFESYIPKSDITSKIMGEIDGIVSVDISFISENTDCLDIWSNINLQTKHEFPVLLGGFNYYPDSANREESVRLDGVNIIFV